MEKRHNPSQLAWRVGLSYLAIAWIWILGSDALLSMMDLTPGLKSLAQTLKGTFFILVTAGLLLRLTSRWELVARDEAARRESAQRALSESEFRFRQMAESIQEVFWLTDLTKQEMLYVNSAYEAIWGRSCQSLMATGKDWLDAIHPEDRPAVIAALPLQSLGRYDESYRIQRPDGEIRWIHDRAFPVRDDEGRVVRVAGVAHDVTATRLAQEAVRLSEERYRHLVELSPFGIFIQRQGQFVFANPAFARMLGWQDGQQLVGKAVLEVLHPDDRQSVNQTIQDLGEGTYTPGEVWERRMLHRDGGIRLVETRAVPYTAKGEQEVQVVVRDVTHSKQIERELERQGAMLASIVDSSLDAILTVTGSGEIVLFNPAACSIFGYSPAEAKTLEVSDLLPFSLELTTESYLVRTGRRRNGEEFPLEVCARSLPGLSLTTISCRDVTERERARVSRQNLEMQLRQAQKMEAVGQLAGGLAHDFNNLLTVILAGASFIREDMESAPQILTEITDAAERAAQLTRQLLAFSRKQVLQVCSVDLNLVVKSTVSLLGRTLSEEITLSASYASELPAIEGDPGMLQQVLMNLAINARDAMPDGGSLRISTFRRSVGKEEASSLMLPGQPGDYVCLEVADSGSGIAADHLPHIFEPFFTTKEVGRGTGLGLATAWGIVEQHHGLLDVSSESQRGTTFRVFLPVALAPASPPPKEGPESGIQSGRGRILLVEDDPAVQRLLSRMLKSCGYKTLLANNGKEALSLWRGHLAEVDLLLTDMVMPEGMSGLELARLLHQERPELKVILISGYSSQMAAANQSGACFLAKPFLSDKLTATVKEVMEGRIAATLH